MIQGRDQKTVVPSIQVPLYDDGDDDDDGIAVVYPADAAEQLGNAVVDVDVDIGVDDEEEEEQDEYDDKDDENECGKEEEEEQNIVLNDDCVDDEYFQPQFVEVHSNEDCDVTSNCLLLLVYYWQIMMKW